MTFQIPQNNAGLSLLSVPTVLKLQQLYFFATVCIQLLNFINLISNSFAIYSDLFFPVLISILSNFKSHDSQREA